jgi:hypothetical protein
MIGGKQRVSMQTERDCLWEAEGEKKAKDC